MKSWAGALVFASFATASGLWLSTAEGAAILGTQLHKKPALTKAGPKGAGPLGAAPLGAGAMPSDGNAIYHVGNTLLCYDCHTIHFSQSHGYAGGTVAPAGALNGDWLPPGGPNAYLLKGATSTDLCLACHDGRTFAPDVVGADSYGVTQRAAGFFGDVDVANFKGHNLSRNPGGKPGSSDLCMRCHFGGSMATASVQCIDCHAHHGNGYYRNLQWASWPGAEPPILASIVSGATGPARYEAGNVGYPAPAPGDTSWREVTNICIDCHHTFFSPAYTGNTSPFHRHPVTNTESEFRASLDRAGAHTDPGHWVSGSGGGFDVPRLKFVVSGATNFVTATTVQPSNEVFCLSCHQAHGSGNAFALRWNYGSPSGGISKAGCQQCHNNVFTE